MPRFDVYPTPLLDEKRHTPYWLDVQADHLDGLATRVVVPLRKVTPGGLLKERLNPELDVDGMDVFADTANIATYPVSLLRRPVANLRGDRLLIENALDFLFTGF
ncbi:MAG: CcdB family protein [Burkholderiaceae bacterium]